MTGKSQQTSSIEYARINKKKIVNEYFRKYPYESSVSPSGIFMAGLPGAGKTEFVDRLISNLIPFPIHIDMDEIAERIQGYKPQSAHIFKGAANIILERVFDHAVSKKINFIMDGTFGHDKAVANIKRAIEPKHNFQIRLYYIYQDPIIAWKNTLAREKVEHRKIDADGFIETFFRLRDNVEFVFKNLQSLVPITVVEKNEDLSDGKVIDNPQNIDKYIFTTLTRDKLLYKINTC